MILKEKLARSIRTIPDFPKPGIMFKDITPILRDVDLCREVAKAAADPYRNMGIERVAGVESRGFLFGMLVAQELGAGFTIIRKKGKLPYKTVEFEYELEYGSAIIEMHEDEISQGQKVIVHDDLLATGGTAEAAAKLIQKVGGVVSGFSFVVGLDFLKGEDRLRPFSEKIVTLINY